MALVPEERRAWHAGASWWQGREPERRLDRGRARQPGPRVGLPPVPRAADGGAGRAGGRPRGAMGHPGRAGGGPQRHRPDPQGRSGGAVRLAAARAGRAGALAVGVARVAAGAAQGRGALARIGYPGEAQGVPLPAARSRSSAGSARPAATAGWTGDDGAAGRGRRLVRLGRGRLPKGGVRRPDGRSGFGRGGKSGLHGNTVPGNARRGATPGKVPQRADRPPGPASAAPAGKGERVRQERTAPAATAAARQTPPGARPSRDDGAAPSGVRHRPVPGRSSGSVARGPWRHGSQRNGHPPAPGPGTEPGLQAACALLAPTAARRNRAGTVVFAVLWAATTPAAAGTYPQNRQQRSFHCQNSTYRGCSNRP